VCVDDVALWTRSNRLQLNTGKTEVPWCATGRRQHQIPHHPVRIGDDWIFPTDSVQNLWIYLDSDTSMRVHVSKTISNCFAALRSIRRCVPRQVLVSQAVSLVLSHLDYGNATLAGLPGYLFDRLRSVLNAAARLVNPVGKFEHVTPLLHDLHWLRVGQRVEFKLAVLMYRCLNGHGPPYLANLASDLHRVADLDTRRRLRSSSSDALTIPLTRLSTVATTLFLWRQLGCGTAYLPL